MKLTHDEMLSQWKLRRYLEPLRSDCRLTRSDGADIDAYAATEMRQWYLKLLSTAPVELLSPKDLTLSATLKRGDGNKGIIPLPAGTVRPVRVRLSGWQRDATIVSDPTSRKAMLQRNRFSCGGVEHPVALWSGDGRLELFSLPTASGLPVIEALTVITDAGEQVYEFDERAWDLLPD